MKAKQFYFLTLVLFADCLLAAWAGAQNGFDTKEALTGWNTRGAVSIDTAKNRAGGNGGALRIGPGGQAIRKLRATDGSGTVEFWVYEDGSKPANPKERRVGPRWGLIQSDGRVLVAGSLYAPYLAGDKSYAASDSDQKNWFQVQYLGLARKPGWHQWRFDFDAAKGLAIYYDGKDVNTPRPRFDWNRTQIKGFNGVALFGDDGKTETQTIWVDDLSVTLGGPVIAQAVLPPPPPPILPESDPAPEKPVTLLPALQGRHPRLLFTAADIPALRQLAQGEGKPFFEQVQAYLGACKPPDHTQWQTDATDAQRQGMWRLPTVALHYVLTGDKDSFNNAVGYLKKFVATPDWETGEEHNSGMAAANIMVGAALAYDWLYNDLDPAFREEVRKNLLLHARWMYYGGHLNKNNATGYWQSDTQNNHRWHRDAGLALSILAVAGDGPGDAWLLSKTLEELQFVAQWLPEDGASHESASYMVFGMPYLVLAFDAADRCCGAGLLKHPFFKNNILFRMHTLAPGLQDAFSYGDSGGAGFINNYLFKCAAVNQDKDLQAAIQRFYAADAKNSFVYGWFSLVWYDANLKGGTADKLAKRMLFPDLGAAFLRDGWDAGNVALMFKCGPYGGAKLNDFRNQTGRYINIAHDDPDCNMFVLAAGGKFLADDDRYAYRKVTRSHNTILVNGKGQIGEGNGHWLQPLKGVDMNTLARIITWKDTEAVTAVEGEAGNAYRGLDRYRRSFLWVPGSYVLLLDDIRGKAPVDVTWLLQAPKVTALDAVQGRYRMANEPAACEFQVVADAAFTGAIGESPADNRGKPLGFQQLQLQANGKQWRLATLFNPWKLAKLSVTLRAVDADHAVITVTGPNFTDTWNWQAAPDSLTPSTIQGARPGGFQVRIGPADKAPWPGQQTP